jgi:hypothetical protein
MMMLVVLVMFLAGGQSARDHERAAGKRRQNQNENQFLHMPEMYRPTIGFVNPAFRIFPMGRISVFLATRRFN